MAVDTADSTTWTVAPTRASWGAIFAGSVAALGIWAMLFSLGLALGLSSINPENAESLKPSSIFTGVWALIVPLVALFIGGVVAGRLAGPVTRIAGAMHGLVMWGVTALVGAWMLVSLVGALLTGVFEVGKGVMNAGGKALGNANPGAIAKTFGLDATDALKPINDKLVAEGKPAITADQLSGAVGEVVQDGVRNGRVDRETLVSAIANQTALSRQDAEEVATRIESQVSAAGSRGGEQMEEGALKAADSTGKAMWGVFGALFLGLVSAIGGAVVGVAKRHLGERPSGVSRPTSPPESILPPMPPRPIPH